MMVVMMGHQRELKHGCLSCIELAQGQGAGPVPRFVAIQVIVFFSG